MSVLNPLYCCIAHRDENLSTINLIGFLSKAYQQVVTLLKAQTGLMRQCRQSQLKNISSMLSSQEEQIEDMGVLSEKLQSLMDDMGKYMDLSIFQNTILPDKNQSNLNGTDFGMTSCESIVSETPNVEETELLKSPVFKKKKLKQRAQVSDYHSNSTHKIQSQSDSKNKQSEKSKERKDCIIQESAVTPVIKDRSLHNCSALAESQVDIIENTPVTKTYKKIGISSLCNVDTIVLPTGKRLKQTMITFTSDTPNRNSTVCKKSLNSKKPLHLSTSSKKGDIQKSFDGSIVLESDDAFEEEIVQDSPKRPQSRSHNKYNLKSTKCSPRHKIKSFRTTDENTVPNRIEKRNRTKHSFPLKALNTETTSQFSPRKFSTPQDFGPSLKEKESNIEICGEDHNKYDQLLSNVDSSPVLAVMENWFHRDAERVNIQTRENKKIQENTSNILQRKRKLSDLADNSASYQDETYFTPMEKKVMHSVEDKLDLQGCQDTRENRSEGSGLPPTKRNLLSSFDIIPPKDEIKFPPVKAGRTKIERAKITGIECWECKQYYKNLGLAEEEIKARKNACSRHRNRFGERPETPDGMWDCIFPDTCSSTLGSR